MTQPNRYFVRDAADQVHDLVAAYRQAAAEARTRVMTDDSIYGDAKTGAIREALDALRQQYGAELASIDLGLRQQVHSLRSAFERQLPTPRAGVEALLGRQAQFARITTLLKSGMKIREVISTATDPEMLHALADELPTMYAAGQVDFQGGIPTGLHLVNARLAQLSGQTAVDAMEAADDAQAGLAVLEPALLNARCEIGATDHRVTSAADFADQLAQYGLRPRSSY